MGNLGIISAYQVVASEISSVRLRAMTLSSGFVMNALFGWVFSFVVPYMFNADEGNLGGKIGFVFVGLGLIGILLAWLEIPETRNKSYAQLDLCSRTGPRRGLSRWQCPRISISHQARLEVSRSRETGAVRASVSVLWTVTRGRANV